MKTRAIIPLAVGLLVGILAIKIFADVLRKARGANSANDMAAVVCANSDIGATSEITATMLDTRMVPRSLAPKVCFGDAKEVEGRVAAMSIAKGMPIVESFLAPKGTLAGMGVRIRDGFRAVAVKVDESSGVAGWLKPGCHVDVVAVMASDGSGANRSTISKVILENAEVLAVGQDIGAKADVSAEVTKSVTLGVLPEDVPKLHLAATKGTLRLAMRNTRDLATPSVAVTTDKDLFGMSATGRPTSKGSSGGITSTILGALFAKQPKMSPGKTDKDQVTLSAGQSAPAKASIPIGEQPWRVEVLKGQEQEEIWFDGSTNCARRVNARTDGRSRGLSSALGGRLLPVSAGTAMTTAFPVSGESSSTESRE